MQREDAHGRPPSNAWTAYPNRIHTSVNPFAQMGAAAGPQQLRLRMPADSCRLSSV
jgi:hypothetical protein